jgi:putative membrane protein
VKEQVSIKNLLKPESMKTFITNLIFRVAAIALIILTIFSCNKHADQLNSSPPGEARLESRKADKDVQFLIKAAEINLQEIELGRLASENAVSKNTKDLGKMIELDQRELKTVLKNLATKKDIAIPEYLSENSKDTYYKLHTKDGADFDKEYCNAMVENHKNAIVLFEKAGMQAEDEDIRSWALATLPVLKNYFDQGMICQALCKNDETKNNKDLK